MTIYLAARCSRYTEMQQIATELEAMGHKITSRWIKGDHPISDDGLSDEAKAEERTRFATEDLQDLENAEWVVSFTEQPRETNSRGGRHVEFGLALGLQKRTIVVGHRENVFHCLPQVEFFSSWKECQAQLADATTERAGACATRRSGVSEEQRLRELVEEHAATIGRLAGELVKARDERDTLKAHHCGEWIGLSEYERVRDQRDEARRRLGVAATLLKAVKGFLPTYESGRWATLTDFLRQIDSDKEGRE